MLLADFGLAAVLLILAIFLIWRLSDLFREQGVWRRELREEKRLLAELELREQEQKAKELKAILKEASK